MSESENLANLQAVYAEWAKGGSEPNFGQLEELMADDFSIVSMDEAAPGLSFAVDSDSKAASLAYLTGIFKQWDMEYFRPEHYVAQGDRVAMFGWCKFRHKVSKHSAECRIANLWTFRDGKLTSLIEVFDSAKAVAAATAPPLADREA